MFQSDFFDFFSRIPYWVVAVIYIPMSAALVGYGVLFAGTPWWSVAPLFVAGWLTWTLWEYWLHRTFFHWQPETSWGPQMHFYVHGVHHKWVFDRFRLVMPPAISLALAVIFGSFYYGIAWSLSGVVDPVWFWCFFAGKIFGYMNYDVTHYYIHHGKPFLGVYKKLRAHHNAHHHNKKFQDRKFGVSTTLWDHVFRTY